jgi:hypothetical protein
VRWLLRIAVIALAAALIAGCGGGDDDGGTKTTTATETTPPPSDGAAITKPEYIERADAICTKYKERTKDLQGRQPDSYEEAADLYTRAIAIFEPAVREFEALPAPKGDERVIESYLDTVREQLTLYERVRTAAEQSDRAKLETYAQDVRELRARARGIAQGYGFKVCGRED